MPELPVADASDDVWDDFIDARCEELVAYLREFILERFDYKPRYVQQQVSSSFGTAVSRTKQFDLYFRLFAKPDDIYPRDCLVIARIGFKQQRAGHGRALIEYLLKLAPKIGYGHIGIECANARSSAFAERLGFNPYESRRHWVGSVRAIRKALSERSLTAAEHEPA
jgi:GNAT superfamily N-acetyltransferase